MASASADIGFMFTAYNLRRLINIIGFNAFCNYLNIFALCFHTNFRGIETQFSFFLLLVHARVSHVIDRYNFKNWVTFEKNWQPRYDMNCRCV
jgi:hypothetical protein